MKIGILTLPLHTNYGGILQAYALQTVLERMGHEVALIEGRPLDKTSYYAKMRRFLSPLKRVVKLYLIPDKFTRDSERYTRRFISKWIKCDTFNSIDSIPANFYDAIIVGSDQIWRQPYVENSLFLNKIENAFLSFTHSWNVKRIAYAASFGTDIWEYDSNSTRICSDLIQHFDAVSVREESGILLCEKHLHHEAVQLLDPALLLSREDYLKLIDKKYRKQKGIMTYILDENKEKMAFVDKLMRMTGMTVFKSNISYDIIDKHARGAVQPPLEQWLQSFEDADMVVTDSFHACVFSILFNKPFIVVPNKARGASRFFSLLRAIDQEYRIVDITLPLSLEDKIMKCPNCDLSELKDKSYEYLRNSLGNAQCSN